MHCQCIKTTPGTPDAGSGDGGSDLDSVDAESPLYGLKCIAKDCFFFAVVLAGPTLSGKN